MSKRILIDAVHPEEIRVVLTEHNRLQDFDFETSTKKQIKSNIYLAKITRVEPSLQAAFVEYGGNKQGFLPFAEIHPDYYQVPLSDKEPGSEPLAEQNVFEQTMSDEGVQPITDSAPAEGIEGEQLSQQINSEENPQQEGAASDSSIEKTDEQVDVISDETVDEDRRPKLYKKYKIQEVIKRNQVVLIQVIKEERGNKGASLTTYLSLAGRYCVFMPNSETQGGISRRISDQEERRRLKSIVDSIETAQGTSLIIRTAGTTTSNAEIARDYEHLKTMWEKIKEQTLSSKAPALIYEEGDIIRRTVRDLYDNTVDEIIVAGEGAHNTVKDIIKTLAPGHSSKIKSYNEKTPIFWRYQVEDELAELYENKANLKSGGYLVINSTEALVAIDVNSGRATKERNVEETATKTNLEAAYEIARQLRLRDLAGLIVIDFIDMMDLKNKRSVERALKDALRQDRARIQIGRISAFGLLEMSRQRLRSSFLESNTVTCPTCSGTGVVRSNESTVVGILRAVDSEAARGVAEEIKVSTPVDIAIYVLNKKREDITQIEERYNVKIFIEADGKMTGHNYTIETVKGHRPRNENKPNKITYASPEYMPPEVEVSSEIPSLPEKTEGDEFFKKRSDSNIVEVNDNANSYGRNNRNYNNNRRRRGGGRRFNNDGSPRENRDNNRDNRDNRGDRDGNRENRGGERDNNRRFEHRNDRKRHGGNQNRDRYNNNNNQQNNNNQNQNSSGGGKESVIKSLWKRIIN